MVGNETSTLHHIYEMHGISASLSFQQFVFFFS